jgi:proline iminopeptidase
MGTLASPDPAVRERAAADWCAWEDVHVSGAADIASHLRP